MSLTLLLFRGGGGTATPVIGVATSSQAQTAAATGAFVPIGVAGNGVTSQAQTVAVSGSTAVANVTGVGATNQGQTIAASGTANPQAVTGTATDSQAQTIAASGSTGSVNVAGIANISQAQTSAAIGDASPAMVDGTGTSSQAQSTLIDGIGGIGGVEQPTFSGDFVIQRKKVYVKRGKQYLIFNSNAEADAYVNAEKAIETAKQSSRGAAKRVIKALKLAKPEIADAPKLEELSSLLAKFNVHYDVIQLEKNNNIAALYHIQSMLYALQQDEDDIELLLLAI